MARAKLGHKDCDAALAYELSMQLDDTLMNVLTGVSKSSGIEMVASLHRTITATTVERTAALQEGLRATVIASGGIGGLLHLTQLYEAGVQAAVCGRALYEERFTLEAAIAACGGIA